MTRKRIFDDSFNAKEILTNSEVATYAGQIINSFLLDQEEIKDYDMKWMDLFTVRETNQPFEKMPTRAKVNYTWKAVGPEENPILATITDGSLKIIPMVKYRTMGEFDADIFKYNLILAFEQCLSDLRDSGWDKLASLHYDLIVASAVNAGNGGTTPLALGDTISTNVVTMKNAGFKPTHILCNWADEDLISASINRIYREQNLYRDLDEAKLPLNSSTTSLKVLSTETTKIASGSFHIVEAKRNLLSLEDTVDKGVVIDDEFSKLKDSEIIYGKIRRGVGCTASGNIRKITIA